MTNLDPKDFTPEEWQRIGTLLWAFRIEREERE